MTAQTRSGVNTGMTFGITLIFLSLIGFTITSIELISGLFGKAVRLNPAAPIPPAALIYLTVFYGLLTIWAGYLATKPTDDEPRGMSEHVATGSIAGLTIGLLIGVFVLVFGLISAGGNDIRTYLAAMSKQSIDVMLYSLPPILGFIVNIAIFTTLGAVGGVLSHSLRYGAFGAAIGRLWQAVIKLVTRNELVKAVQNSRYSTLIVYGLIIILIIIIPTQLNKFWNYNVGTVGIYILLGLGLNIVVGMAGLLDLGYVAFFAIGAYTVALLTAPAPHDLGWSFWVALPIGILLAGLAGILLGIPVLRMRGDYLAIVTLGFGEIIRILSKSDALTGFSGGPRGVRDIAGPMLFGRPFNSELHFVYLILIGCIILIFITARLQNSRVGRAWVAMREDETVAQAMGINTWQYKLMAFAMGAAFAGMGGVLFASRNQFTGPEDHNLLVSINVLSLVIVGGMGSIPGVIVGALTLKGLPEALRQLDTFRMLAFGGLLVAMMILRPEGLWPSKRVQHELEYADHAEEKHPPKIPTPTGGDK